MYEKQAESPVTFLKGMQEEQEGGRMGKKLFLGNTNISDK